MMQLGLGLAALVIVLDQLSKWLILAFVMNPPRVIEVTGFFNLILVHNRGISFGIFGGQGSWQPWILSGLSVAVVIGLLIWLRGQQNRFTACAIGLIVGGALGNVIDRLRFEAVVDFLDFHLGGWHWPAFNVADSAITVGVVLLIWESLFMNPERRKT